MAGDVERHDEGPRRLNIAVTSFKNRIFVFVVITRYLLLQVYQTALPLSVLNERAAFITRGEDMDTESTGQNIINDIETVWAEDDNDLEVILGRRLEETEKALLSQMTSILKNNALFNYVINVEQAAYEFSSLRQMVVKVGQNCVPGVSPTYTALEGTRQNISTYLQKIFPFGEYEFVQEYLISGVDHDAKKEYFRYFKKKEEFMHYNLRIRKDNRTYHCRTCSPLFAVIVLKYWNRLDRMRSDLKDAVELLAKINQEFVGNEELELELSDIDAVVYYYCIESHFGIAYRFKCIEKYEMYLDLLKSEYEKKASAFVTDFVDSFKAQVKADGMVRDGILKVEHDLDKYAHQIAREQFHKEHGSFKQYKRRNIPLLIVYFSKLQRTLIFGQEKIFALLFERFQDERRELIHHNRPEIMASKVLDDIRTILHHYQTLIEAVFAKRLEAMKDALREKLIVGNDATTAEKKVEKEYVEMHRQVCFFVLEKYAETLGEDDKAWIERVRSRGISLSIREERYINKIQSMLSASEDMHNYGYQIVLSTFAGK